MDRILKILKKENGPRASSAPALELNTIIFKHVYWYMQQISGEHLQDHWSSGFFFFFFFAFNKPKIMLHKVHVRNHKRQEPSTEDLNIIHVIPPHHQGDSRK